MRADIFWEAHGRYLKRKRLKSEWFSECCYYTAYCYRGGKEATAEDDLLNTAAVWRSVQTNRWRGKCQRLPVMAAVFRYLQALLCSPLNEGSRQRMMEMAVTDRKGLRGEGGRESRVWATRVGKILWKPKSHWHSWPIRSIKIKELNVTLLRVWRAVWLILKQFTRGWWAHFSWEQIKFVQNSPVR